jgi:alkanesulfonate monooxygenase SsuD/methylene tetrahydromethanopterin reductase-like flavin-dependent oxidoreductase (luciferase family)
MAVFRGEVGLQFTTHLASHYTVPQWVELAEYAQRSGFTQLWINDNLGHRNIFVLLTAIASRVPIKLGTAILVPYFRNPIDTADAFASLSELMGGREISVGIARGDYAQAGNQINMIKPIGMVKETVECLKSLLRGDMVQYADYPVLSEFFNLRSKSGIQLGFTPQSPILFYSGGNGPRIMEIAGRVMDGVLIGGFFIPLVRSGKLAALLEKTERGRMDAGRQTTIKKVCEINISVSHDYEKARNFPKRYIAHMLVVLEAMGFSNEEFQALGVDRETVIQIRQAFETGGTIEQVSALITDGMVDVGFIAGTPRDCVKPLEEMCAYAQEYGFDQICLAKLGPDYEEAITVLSRDLLPSIVQR